MAAFAPDSRRFAVGVITTAGGSSDPTSQVVVGSNGAGSWVADIRGVFTSGSTLVFEVSVDAVNWYAVPGADIGALPSVLVFSVTGSASAPVVVVGSVSGYERVRVRATSVAPGDAIVVTLGLATVASTFVKVVGDATALGQYNAAAPVLTGGQVAPLQLDSSGNLRVNVVAGGAGGGTVTQGPAAALAGAWPVEVTDGTNVLGTAVAPLRTDPTGTTTQPVSGGVTAAQGAPAALSASWPVEVTDGTNGPVAVKPAGTGAAAADAAAVVALSPNSALPGESQGVLSEVLLELQRHTVLLRLLVMLVDGKTQVPMSLQDIDDILSSVDS